ncbi:Toxoplasma gondii family A protein [Toxoplasma gondii RUB]|uniref:Toxoplasma gondii family A protein n=3 Tax=Toxoplasma gondii TaxID=5811 RepID=A0A086LPK6_TOXGO|nr:Toxoplasma gondii family A protein [Toxoplasma gondii RUB]KFH12517.1 Toxoplasma gondii family A protein [Toxoplasma gondii MAS]PUA85144.1 Toxoplasma gondii family A protein [Toxoplasma gondii TgCATBr9]
MRAAYGSSKPPAEADFTATIPKAGLEGNVEKVFSLGPSNTLRVIDETAKAVYEPENNATPEEASSESYSVAYRYENGACDFTQTIRFKDAYPGYSTELWVREEFSSATRGDSTSPEGPVRYTFTSPPAEYLPQRLSFCVRFKAARASGSDSPTKTTTPTTTVGSSDPPRPPVDDTEDTQDEDTQIQDQPSDGDSAGEGTQGSTGGVTQQGSGAEGETPRPGGEAPDVGQQESPAKDDENEREQEERGTTAPHLSPDSPTGPGHSEAHPEAPLDPSQDQSDSSPTAPAKPLPEATLPENEGDPDVNSDTQEVRGAAALRRLDGTSAVKEAYLTIVVHSSGWSSADGMGGVSGLLLTMVAALFQVYQLH